MHNSNAWNLNHPNLHDWTFDVEWKSHINPIILTPYFRIN